MVSDISAHCLCPDVADAPAKLARGPKTAFSEYCSEPWECSKQLPGRPAFEEAEGFRDTHAERKGNKKMNMVSTDVHLVNDDFVLRCSFNQGCFNQPPHRHIADNRFPVFGAPLKVELI